LKLGSISSPTAQADLPWLVEVDFENSWSYLLIEREIQLSEAGTDLLFQRAQAL
jgi:hypothetical protein